MLIETIPMRVPKERSPDYVEVKDMDARTMEVFEEGQMDEAAYQRRAEAATAGALVELTALQAQFIKKENARRKRDLRKAKRKAARTARKKNR